MTFTRKYPNFFFFFISLFLVPLADTILAELLPERLPLGGFIFVQGG